MANPQSEPSMDEILASIRRIIAEEDEPVTEQVPSPEPLDLRAEAALAEALVEEAPTPRHVAPEADVAQQVSALQAAMQASEALDAPAEEPVFETEEPQAAIANEAPQAALADEVDFENFGLDEPVVSQVAPADETPVVEAVVDRLVAPASVAQTKTTPAPVIEAVVATKQPDVVSAEEIVTKKSEKAFGDYAPEILERVQDSMLSKVSAGAATTAFEALAENVRIADGPGKTMEDLIKEMVEPMLRQWLDQNLPRVVEDKVEEEVRRLARRR